MQNRTADVSSRWPNRLWIVRHGESAGNVARDEAHAANLDRILLEGRDVDVPLSDLGERQSTALGFSQALDGTWARYKRETGRWTADRTDFGDAVRFIGWYHSTSSRVNGVRLNDTYGLYLNYYFGHKGYANGSWRSNAAIQRAARRSANMAERYEQQLQQCGQR